MSGLFKPTVLKGTRITDFAKTSADVGGTIPFLYGRAPVPGNVGMAKLPPTETKTTKKQGKGGVKQEIYTYDTTYAILFCRGPIRGYWWIKRNGKVVYSIDPAVPIEDQAYAAKWAAKVQMYNGTMSQMPSSVIEAIKGVGRVSAMRGMAYIVVPRDDVTEGGGALPVYEAVPIASPAEGYITSHPYAQTFSDAGTAAMRPVGGEMRSVVFKGKYVDLGLVGLTPSGGELKTWVPPEARERVVTGLVPSGGEHKLPPLGEYEDATETGFEPAGGVIFNPPLGRYYDETETGLEPTGGELSGTPTPPEEDGFVSKFLTYWKFDENLDDFVGSYDLTAGAAVTYAAGKQGTSATCPSYMYGGMPAALLATASFCMGGWIKLSSNTLQVVFAARSGSTGYEAASLTWYAGSLYAQIRTANTPGDQTNAIWTPPGGYASLSSDLVHMVLRLDEGVLSLFVDGVEKASVAMAGTPFAAADQTLFGYIYGSSYNQVYDECFYSSALSDDDIAWLYNSGAGRSYEDIAARTT